MNVLLLAYGGDTPAGYDYLLKIALSFKKKGHNVIFAIDNQYFVDASFVTLDDYKVYSYDKWASENTNYVPYKGNIEISQNIAYVNYERLNCWNARKSLHNYTISLERDVIDKYLAFFLYVIDKEKIDLVLHETVSSLQAYEAYIATTIKGIPFLGWILSRIPGRFDLNRDPFGNEEEIKKTIERINLKEITIDERENYQEYIDKIGMIKPDYMKNNPMSMDINYVKQYSGKIGKVMKLLPIIFGARVDDSYYIKYPLELKLVMLRYNLLRQAKIKLLKRRFDEIEENDRYFLFPLHFQPEASTAVNAPYYCNQADVIRCVAFSLPRHIKLYVKDHPNGIGFMRMSAYKDILNLPNVKYIDPQANTKKLIKDSIGIITITSTMGYEALLMKKPVITLGHVFYNAHPYCNHIKGYDELYSAMIGAIENNRDKFEEYNLKFVKAYWERSYEGKLLDDSPQEINKVVDAIIVEANK